MEYSLAQYSDERRNFCANTPPPPHPILGWEKEVMAVVVLAIMQSRRKYFSPCTKLLLYRPFKSIETLISSTFLLPFQMSWQNFPSFTSSAFCVPFPVFYFVSCHFIHSPRNWQQKDCMWWLFGGQKHIGFIAAFLFRSLRVSSKLGPSSHHPPPPTPPQP